jgi:nickel-dependent lactate racemase
MNPVDFAVDVTLNRAQQITRVFAGDLLREHSLACAFARTTAMQPLEYSFDLVVTTNSGYPLDQNLYQAVKGMSAAAQIVKPGGAIICAAECRDGIPNHGAYGRLLASRGSARELLEMINAPGFSEPDQWQVQIQSMIQMKARVLVRADGLTSDQVRAAHFEPVSDVSDAVRAVLSDAGANARVCVLPQGPQTIAYLQ